ncbi:MAG: hypothetical protein AAGF96_22855, partial [Bacteroidota bacterium]
MKTISAFLLLTLGSCYVTFSQVKIGDNPQTLHPASLLELEGNSRALVITRVTNEEMLGILPLNGAIVYNTDADCVFYYSGLAWVDLCSSTNTTNVSLEVVDSELILTDSDGNTVSVPLEGAVTQSFTHDAVVNPIETITITRTGNNLNFEVTQITGENIVDSSINGFNDIQPSTITENQLAPDSVGESELQDNSVTDAAIDYAQVTLTDFDNDAMFITSAEIVSPDPNNVLTDNGGAFYDDSAVQNEIQTNSDLINQHITDDQDIDANNERITNAELQGTNLVISEGGTVSFAADLSSLDNAGSDIQDISTDSSPGNITIDNGSTLTLNVNDGDFNDQNEIQDASEVEVNPTGNLNSDNVQLALEELQTDVDALTSGGGADGVVSDIIASGNNLVVTGANGGFNGNVNLEPLVDNAVSNNGFLIAEVDGSLINELTDLDFDPATNILSLTNPATAGGASVNLSTLAGGSGTTEIADQITITGLGTGGDPFTIEPSTVNGQFLRTDPVSGNVVWDDLPTGTGGAVNSDGVTIQGDGVATNLQVVDGGIDNIQLADNSVTTAKILDGEVQTDDIADANVTEQKINPSATDGQVLTTVGGNVQWAAPTTGAVQTLA